MVVKKLDLERSVQDAFRRIKELEIEKEEFKSTVHEVELKYSLNSESINGRLIAESNFYHK